MTDVLPFPADLPALSPSPRLLVLGDMDALSHGLAEGSGCSRASDERVWAVLEQVMLTASGLGSRRCPVRWAASSATARCHLDLMTRSANNVWSIRRGLDAPTMSPGRAGVPHRRHQRRGRDLADRDADLAAGRSVVGIAGEGPVGRTAGASTNVEPRSSRSLRSTPPRPMAVPVAPWALPS